MNEAIELQNNQPGRWMRLSLLNFVLVASAGTLLRYKVTFPLPGINFENLLHAHSHFAFAGWVSSALFALLIGAFVPKELQSSPTYRWLFLLSQVTSYGMLVSFFIQEYGPVSIGFSTAYIFVTYGYAYLIYKHTRVKRKSVAVRSMHASLFFLLLSSLGPYALAIMISTHSLNGAVYHNAIYWYLHFQYNGWFSFALFALLFHWLEHQGVNVEKTPLRTAFRLMLAACIPAYLLSILWILPPVWIYVVAGSGAFMQLFALYLILKELIRERRSVLERKHDTVSSLFLFSTIAFTIKLLLQFLSIFPELNQFVFGHRPVIIGYLHLVMLGFVSFFIFGYAIREGYVSLTRSAKTGIWIFVVGVLLNESGLMLQGFSGILYTSMTWIPELLFIASVTMLAGLATLATTQLRASTHLLQSPSDFESVR